MKDLQHAIRMKRRGASCANIAAVLGKSAGAVEAKLKHSSKATAKISAARSIETPASCPMEEQIRRSAPPCRDLTGVICGDPEIGYSALDRRRAETPAARRGS
jgi:hypothetical protein